VSNRSLIHSVAVGAALIFGSSFDGVAAARRQARPVDSPEQAVRARRAEFNRALASHDTTILRQVLADSVTLVSPAQYYQGRAESVSHYAALTGHAGENLTLVFDPSDVRGAPPFVSEYGTFENGAVYMKDVTGQYFAAWVLGADGRWMLTVQAWTAIKCSWGACGA
jgi:hypothetical protein